MYIKLVGPSLQIFKNFIFFQYVPSLRKTLKYLNICLSAFSEVYYAGGDSFMQRTKNTVMLGKLK